jgi:molybdopterin molybdotransferase
MHTIDQARAILRTKIDRLPTETIPLSSAVGRSLGAPIIAQDDSPPFDKSMMDGIAIDAVEAGPWKIIATIPAGAVPGKTTIAAGEAARIMTGAPIPPGANAVIRQEDIRYLAEDRVESTVFAKPGQNIVPQGSEFRAGDTVLEQGTAISPAVIGILANLGVSTPKVTRQPRVVIIPNGDELVPHEATPGMGQIRNSNGPMLAALVTATGGLPTVTPIVPDDAGRLREQLLAVLPGNDVVILSAGLSVGERDFVPAVLQECGIQLHIYKVAIKPGKPFLFGTRGAQLFFGLPGNPVSSLVAFEIFVRPALRALRGEPFDIPGQLLPTWEGFETRHDRPTYLPIVRGPNGFLILPWGGSSDLKAYALADALIQVPAGAHTFTAGTDFNVHPLLR